MNAIILGTAGIMLLLSSATSLIFLLKRNLKKCITSSIYLLITSDILSSVLTAVLLFINQYNEIISERHDDGSNDVMKILKKLNETSEDNINNCDLKTIIMNYSLFLVPFVNSFVSLLSMSIQYNFDVEILRKKCRNIMNTVENRSSVLNNFADKRNTFTAFSVASQWLLPIILTLILQFAKREEVNNNNRASHVTCALTMNFPFESCYSVITEDLAYSNFNYNLTDKDNYIDNLSLNKIQKNSSETDQVVASIYNIVQTMMNDSGVKFERPESHYNQTQLLSITNYTKIPEETVDYEVELFEELMKNSSISTENPIENFDNNNPTTTEMPATTSMKIELKSDVEIHRDIMQKIQSVNTKLIVKNRRKPTISPIGRLYLGDETQVTEEFLDEMNPKVPKCLKNECFISPDFLKIHLLLLLIFVYFGPILVSALLNMRSRHVCVNALETLEILGKKTLRSGLAAASTSSEPQKIGWFAAKQADETEEADPPEVREEGEMVEQDGDCLQGMKEEAEKIRKLADTFRSSLVMGIALWTPMFMEIFMKVFLCSDPPMWIMNCFYLLAISFGAVRNYLNLRILRSSEIVRDTLKKTNIVHPSGTRAANSQ